jgi:hypothetical protein
MDIPLNGHGEQVEDVRMTELGPATEAPPPSLQTLVPSFELFFRPSIELISVTRRFVAEFYREVLDDSNASDRIALTTHELLENAAKYSTDGTAALYVEVDRSTRSVLVRATNRATPEQIAKLRDWFGAIAAAPDADSLYASVIQTTAKQTSGSGGIGLARIWAESQMSLQLKVDGDSVAVLARGRFGSP